MMLPLVYIFGFYMAWNIGANDVANSMASAVGAKAITIRQAIFIAGILPGLLLVALFLAYIVVVALLRPEKVGGSATQRATDAAEPPVTPASMLSSLVGIFAVVVSVLGGIWFGFFTPTEAAGVGVTIERGRGDVPPSL